MTHLANHITQPYLRSDNTLHVIGVCSNPARWHSRYRLTRQWMEEMERTPHVKLHMVETAFADRCHEVTESEASNHLQLRTKTEIWNKEAMINLAVRYLLPRDWKYMAWVDADIHFRNPNWALDTIHELQHYAVIQPWQHALDLGFKGNVMKLAESFGSVHAHGKQKQKKHKGDCYTYAHPGYAWACTRQFWEQSGGLLDFCILGSGDFHMAWAMIGDAAWTLSQCSPQYCRRVMEWQQRVIKVTHKHVGYVHGRIEHNFHGAKANRQYVSRRNILERHNFDPDKHLVRDEQGLFRLEHPQLERAIHKYNRSRGEDSIDE